MSLNPIHAAVRDVVTQLVAGEYDQLVEKCANSRLSGQELREAVRDYGRVLTVPPPDAYQELDVVSVTGAHPPTWSVHAPLWTEEEGRSDLTLELTISLGTDGATVELDDLHVL